MKKSEPTVDNILSNRDNYEELKEIIEQVVTVMLLKSDDSIQHNY